MLDIPTCPDCGKLAEDLGDGEIYCEDCFREWWEQFYYAVGGREGMAILGARLKQNFKLGIGLDRKPDE